MNFNDQIERLMELHPDLFPTKAKVWQYLRGALRRGLWERSPMKHKFKQSKMTPPPEGYTGRGKKGTECALTGEWTMTSHLEVDHKEGHKPLLEEKDIVPYIIHLLGCGDQLQCVEKEAHKIKSYAERKGISFEEAKLEKMAIAFGKLPKDAQETFFVEKGVTPPTNAKTRRERYKELVADDK